MNTSTAKFRTWLGDFKIVLKLNYDHSNSLKTEDNDDTKVYEQSEFRNDIFSFEDIKKVIGRQWKSSIPKLNGLIIRFWDNITRDKIYDIPICQTDTRLLNEYKSSMNINNVLKLATKIDLIKCVDDYYSFGHTNLLSNKAKKYIFNKKIIKILSILIKKEINVIDNEINDNNYILVKELDFKDVYFINKNKIKINNVINVINNEINDNNYILDQKLDLKLKFNSSILIDDVRGLTPEQALPYLHTTYPLLNDYIELADRINQRCYCNDKYNLGIRFVPKFTMKDNVIKKISIRATNGICNLKEHDNGRNTNKLWRKDFLKSYFKTDEYLSFDVKSSIYRITYLLNTGVWLPNHIDLYKMMFADGDEILKSIFTPELRDQFKLFCMRMYFDKSEKSIWKHMKFAGIDLPEDDDYTYRSTIKMFVDRMVVVLGGETYDSEIFLHESCIYMMLLNILTKDYGLDIVQVYDGFYTIPNDKIKDQKQFETICCELLDKIAVSYFKKIKNS